MRRPSDSLSRLSYENETERRNQSVSSSNSTQRATPVVASKQERKTHTTDISHPEITTREVVPPLGILILDGHDPPEASDGVLPVLRLDVRATEDEPGSRVERVDGESGFEERDGFRELLTDEEDSSGRSSGSGRGVVGGWGKDEGKTREEGRVSQHERDATRNRARKRTTHPPRLLCIDRASRQGGDLQASR